MSNDSGNNISTAGIGMTSLRTRTRLIDRLSSRGIQNERVLNTILETPRHLFVGEAISHKAYEDTALPIGYEQTISQPYIVALMTEMILENSGPLNKVLEIGTGCGYQTAILSQLVKWVFTIERIDNLQQEARDRLGGLGYRNISYLNADGFLGWSSNQPFDGIIVTAAPASIPEALLEQLAVNGGLVIPVGGHDQYLKKITRTHKGHQEEIRNAVHFVPMLKGKK